MECSNDTPVRFSGRERLNFLLTFLALNPTGFPLGAQLVNKLSLLLFCHREHTAGAVFTLVKASVTPEKAPSTHLINKQRQHKCKDDEVDSVPPAPQVTLMKSGWSWLSSSRVG